MAAKAFAAAIAPDEMTIRDISRRWATELNIDWTDLENRLITVSLEGLFDDLPIGLLFLDHREGTSWATTGAKVRESLKESGQFMAVLRSMQSDGALGLHKDAVLLFAGKHGLDRPSWWRSMDDDSRKPGRPVSQLPRVLTEMRKLGRSRLKAMKQVEMETTFKAGRGTCEKARKEVLSEITD